MAGVNKGPLRHIVLLKVEKKEDVPEVVETLANMSKEIVKHVSWLNFDINSDLGISGGNADVGLVIDFPDEENFHTYQKHDLHVAAVTHNKKFVVSRTAIQMPLPKSSL
ncbi:hypothetical protein M758_9G017900 [Ceratodon purpureus]|uniref:Stress-response A/B barrel domain-containing protein n=1 Tax=Ceratodon purpureus TaxID=3225 RepID=A0A8T0GPJ9_CERPU|nr:hypothetical protein KC19_9G018100 [Ceratodon purpureus]KAG0604903.1 hypothetical protein M758_9G017900 [Ceratodon purpureus]